MEEDRGEGRAVDVVGGRREEEGPVGVKREAAGPVGGRREDAEVVVGDTLPEREG